MPAANPVDLAAFTPVLKNVYLPFRKKAFPMLTPLLAQVKKAGPDRVSYAGNDLFFDVKVDRRGGFISSAAGYFPTSKIAQEKQGRLSIARTYAQVAVDGLALKATKSKKGAYISVAKKVVEDLMEQWTLEQNRVLHGDSLGIRAVQDTDSGSGVFICDNPYGITDAGPGNLHLVPGDDVAFVDVTNHVVHGKSQISSISLSGDAATITLAADITGTGAGDYMVTCVPTATSATDTSFGAEPHGIKSLVDVEDNFLTYEGINDDRWATYNTTAAAIDETTLMSFLNVIRARGGVDWRRNPKSMLLLTTTGIWQAYGETLLGLRRFSAPTMNLNGGFTGVQVANATLIDDPWAPRGRLYAIHTSDLLWVDLMDFGELSYEDSPTWQLSTTQDKYTATFGTYWNFGALMRNTHGVISGITDSTNYSPVF